MPDGKNPSDTSISRGKQQIRPETTHSDPDKTRISPRGTKLRLLGETLSSPDTFRYRTRNIASNAVLDLDESTDAESEYHEAYNHLGPELDEEHDQNGKDEVSHYPLQSHRSEVNMNIKYSATTLA
jgi:hypothetical protein